MEKKFYIDYYKAVTDEDYLFDMVCSFKEAKIYNNVKLFVSASKSEVLNNLFYDNVLKICSYIRGSGIGDNEVAVCLNINQYVSNKQGDINDKSYFFSASQWENIENIYNKLAQKNIEFLFDDQTSSFTLNQVKIANSKIKSVAQKIKSSNLSPLESLFVAYKTVTNKRYLDVEDLTNNYGVSRSPYGILNSNKVVCVGYVNWLNAILDELGIKNVKLYTNNVAVTAKNSTGLHTNVVVYIKDDKYNLDGYYLLDPAWDSIKDKNLPKIKLDYFLTPIKNIKNIKKTLRRYDKLPDTSLAMRESNIINDFSHSNNDNALISFSSDNFYYSNEFLDYLLQANPSIVLMIDKKFGNGVNKTSNESVRQQIKTWFNYDQQANLWLQSVLEKKSKQLTDEQLKTLLYRCFSKSPQVVESVIKNKTKNSEILYIKTNNNILSQDR